MDNSMRIEIDILLKKGIRGNEFFLFYTDMYFYVQISDIRCFKFSMRRAKNTLRINEGIYVKEILYHCIQNISIEKQNENLFFLNINYPKKHNEIYNINHKIKLKEINNFINLSDLDNQDTIIKKQNEKINSLLNKINEFENKCKDPDTDEEMFLTYK